MSTSDEEAPATKTVAIDAPSKSKVPETIKVVLVFHTNYLKTPSGIINLFHVVNVTCVLCATKITLTNTIILDSRHRIHCTNMHLRQISGYSCQSFFLTILCNIFHLLHLLATVLFVVLEQLWENIKNNVCKLCFERI